MFGQNRVLKADLHPDRLLVQEVFYTVQGEGPFSGYAAIFVRLAGCNLRCFFCDTDFESAASWIHTQELAERVLTMTPPRVCNLVVITGGEPLRQDLAPLCKRLLSEGYTVQIETAGTLWPFDVNDPIPDALHFVCSPKTPSVHPEIERRCNDWKYIIDARDEASAVDGLPVASTQVRGAFSRLYRPAARAGTTIWVQPASVYLDAVREEVHDGHHPSLSEPLTHDAEANRANHRRAAELVMQYGYRLSAQVHKYFNLP